MMEASTALELLLKGMEPALEEINFKASPVEEAEGKLIAAYAGEDGTLRLELFDDKAALLFSPRPPEEAEEGDFARISLSLLELEAATEKDCKSVAEDFSEEVVRRLRKRKPGAPLAPGKKPPKSISKSAIKNGDAYYDALSFANSFTGIYPELRAAYKENYEKYGEFLAEEFFLQHGNAAVLATIRQNDALAMRRLFSLLNDVYENGVNEVQSLVTVTILGVLENDEALLAGCVDYMSKDLAPVVIRLNKYLASPAGKKARAQLETPPPYKPKKEKKPGLFQQLLGGGGNPGMPGI
ncbi:MAG: hypothetical protein LBS96_02360 [Oscillospiraceae bacterium]|nr:hypothetical protein [Oscillospiraceae bacterium]